MKNKFVFIFCIEGNESYAERVFYKELINKISLDTELIVNNFNYISWTSRSEKKEESSEIIINNIENTELKDNIWKFIEDKNDVDFYFFVVHDNDKIDQKEALNWTYKEIKRYLDEFFKSEKEEYDGKKEINWDVKQIFEKGKNIENGVFSLIIDEEKELEFNKFINKKTYKTERNSRTIYKKVFVGMSKEIESLHPEYMPIKGSKEDEKERYIKILKYIQKRLKGTENTKILDVILNDSKPKKD